MLPFNYTGKKKEGSMIALLSFLLISVLATVGVFLFYPAPTEDDLGMKISVLLMNMTPINLALIVRVAAR